MHGNNESISVVVPFYKNELATLERQSLIQNLVILQRYPFTFIKPRSLDLDLHGLGLPKDKIRNIRIVEFEDGYFASIKGYNKLLLSEFFYEQFAKSEYILICQLDAYVFSDELDYWRIKSYDYIGSPWPKKEADHLFKTLLVGKLWPLRIMKFVNRLIFQKTDFAIGNGGLSLRNVRKSARVLRQLSSISQSWKENEDLFWSIIVPLINPTFRVPNLQDGVGFAFEKDPEYFFSVNNYRLPFGCHAWQKHQPEFWMKFINSVK